MWRGRHGYAGVDVVLNPSWSPLGQLLTLSELSFPQSYMDGVIILAP